MRDNLLQQHETARLWRLPGAGQRRGRQDEHKLRLFAFFSGQQQRQQQLTPGHGRPARLPILRQQGQLRLDVLAKAPFQPGKLPCVQRFDEQRPEAGVRDVRQNAGLPDGELLLHKPVGVLRDEDQLFLRRQARGVRIFDARERLRAQIGKAHHEKFIQIGSRNGKVFQPFQRGVFKIGGFGEHTPVKPKPAQLAVEKAIQRVPGREALTHVLTPLHPCHAYGILFSRIFQGIRRKHGQSQSFGACAGGISGVSAGAGHVKRNRRGLLLNRKQIENRYAGHAGI